MPADLYPYGNNPLENAQSIVTRLPVFRDFCAKNSPRRGGSVPRGIERKVFLKEGKLYDEDYRILSRSSLIGGRANPIREILLSGADNIYCFGSPDKSTKEFLKKYYGEKVVFC